MASIDVGIHPDPAGITAHHFAASRTSNRFSTLVCEVSESRVAIFIDSRNNRAVLDALQAALDEIRADMGKAEQTASDQVPTVMADWAAGPPGEAVEVFGK